MECSLSAIKSGFSAIFVPNFENKKTIGIQAAVTVLAGFAAAIACRKVDGLAKHLYGAVLALATAYVGAIAYHAYRHFKSEQTLESLQSEAAVTPSVAD